MLDLADGLPTESLDKPVLEKQERLYGSGTLTLRVILEAMGSNKENWCSAISGEQRIEEECKSVEALKERLNASGPQFQRLVKGIRDKGDWDSGFVDALCDPPESFTCGGMLAHVFTFSA